MRALLSSVLIPWQLEQKRKKKKISSNSSKGKKVIQKEKTSEGWTALIVSAEKMALYNTPNNDTEGLRIKGMKYFHWQFRGKNSPIEGNLIYQGGTQGQFNQSQLC